MIIVSMIHLYYIIITYYGIYVKRHVFSSFYPKMEHFYGSLVPRII